MPRRRSALFTSTAPTVSVGDKVQTTGTVTEFRGGAATNLTMTEITSPSIVKISAGNPLPAAVVLGAGERLFEGVNLPALGYACTQHVATSRATHLVFSRT